MYLIYTLAEPHTYRKWEPIDTGKFGFDVSVRPSSRPPVQTLGVGVKKLSRLRKGVPDIYVAFRFCEKCF